MGNFPEQVNQTFIGLAIGLIAIYFFKLRGVSGEWEVMGIIFLVFYSFIMGVLSILQMVKNTWRYWHKEKLNK